jgi:outer membrane protein
MRITVSASASAVVWLVMAGGVAQAQAALTGTAAHQPTTAFPADARVAFVDVDRVAAMSAEGRAASAKLEALRASKSADLEARSQALNALQVKLTTGATVMADEATSQLQWELQRAQIDFRRASEDAQSELQQAQQETMRAFSAKLSPIIGEVAMEKRVWAVFGAETGLLWNNPAIDLTEEVAKRLDADAKRP